MSSALVVPPPTDRAEQGPSSQSAREGAWPRALSNGRAVVGFLNAVTHRLKPRGVLVAFAVMVALVLVGGLGLVTPIWSAPIGTIMSRLFETLTVGAAIFVAVVMADEAVERGLPPLATYGIAVLTAAVFGAWLGWELRQASGLRFLTPPGYQLKSTFPLTHRLELVVIGILVGGIATFVHVSRRTAMAARARQHAAEQARSAARRRTIESQLQALQARVEPMFLFDTLARIGTLYDSDADAAGAMLEDLIVYLRAALPHMRESSSTVAQELALTRSWLDIVGRGVPGSRVDIDTDDAALVARLPALVLLPLAQHAAAGTGRTPLQLKISARHEPGCVRLRVASSNAAFAGGIAGHPLLEQIAERLHAIHGDRAALAVQRAETGAGSEALVELPLDLGHEVEPPIRGEP